MTNKEILEKVIEKAIKNGWNTSKWFKDNKGKWNTPELYIFNHEFAKMFWREYQDGKRTYFLTQGIYRTIDCPSWQYHLQQMVLEKKPLKYLEKFL